VPQLLRIDFGGLTITQQTVIAPSYPLAFTRRSTSRASHRGEKKERRRRLIIDFKTWIKVLSGKSERGRERKQEIIREPEVDAAMIQQVRMLK
jgi:hypothetical protein